MNKSLYLQGQPPWDEQTLVAVYYHRTDEEYDDSFSRFAVEQQLQAVISVDILQDVVDNARFQKADISIDELITAFNYYYAHDTFKLLS